MAHFVGQTGAAAIAPGPLASPDHRNIQRDFRWAHAPTLIQIAPFTEGTLWTSSGGIGGGLSGYGSLDGDTGTSVPHWEPWDSGGGWEDTGGQKQNVIVGQTLNSSGAALPGCTVRLFLTSSNAFVGSVVSDNGGYYRIPTPYGTAVAHYVVAFLAGSPDVSGATDNTLVPTATG